MPLCLGRRTTPKTAPLFFETGPRLHRNKPLSFLGPVRCAKEADDLCADCLDRQKATEYQLVKRAGKYIPNQETMFHGRISETIPEWSRLYGGPWYLAQIEAGYQLSEETQRKVAGYKEISTVSTGMTEDATKAKKVVKRLKKPVTKPVEKPVDMLIQKSVEVSLDMATTLLEKPPEKPLRTKKFVPKPAEKPAAPEPIPEPVKPVVEEAAPPKKFQIKAPRKPRTKKEEPTKPVIGRVEQIHMEDTTVVKVHVKKAEVDGRSVYISATKDKVYDMKFKYIGRWNKSDDRIDTTYADSDEEP